MEPAGPSLEEFLISGNPPPGSNPFLDNQLDANIIKAGFDFVVTPEVVDFNQKAFNAIQDIQTKCSTDYMVRCQNVIDYKVVPQSEMLPFQVSSFESPPAKLTPSRHLLASTIETLKSAASLYKTSKISDENLRLQRVNNLDFRSKNSKSLNQKHLRNDAAMKRRLSSDEKNYEMKDEHHHYHDHGEEENHSHHHDSGHNENHDENEDENEDEDGDENENENVVVDNTDGEDEIDESSEDMVLIDPNTQNPPPVTSIVLPSLSDFLPFQIPGFQINLPGLQVTIPGTGQNMPPPPPPQPFMDPSFTFNNNNPPQQPPVNPMGPPFSFNIPPQGSQQQQPPINPMMPPQDPSTNNNNNPIFGFFPPNIFNIPPPVYTTYPVDGPMNPVSPVNNGMSAVDPTVTSPTQPESPSTSNIVTIDDLKPVLVIEPMVDPMPPIGPPPPPVSPHGHHPHPPVPPMEDYYRFSLGYGSTGDMCMKKNYSQLSQPCQDSIRFLYDTHRDYVAASVSAHADRDDDFHRHHFHHFDMFWPIAFVTLILALFIKKAYFHRHTKHRHQKINAVLQIIRENPTLKAVVEADTGFVLPEPLPLGCPFHREGSVGYRIVKVIGIVILALATVTFSLCVTATILLSLAVDPETGDVNPPSPYIAALIFLGTFAFTGGVMYGTIKTVRYLLGSSSSSSTTSAASDGSNDSAQGGGNVIVVTTDGNSYNNTQAQNDLTSRIRQQVNDAIQALSSRLRLNNTPASQHGMYVPLRDQESSGEDVNIINGVVVRNPVNASAPPHAHYTHTSASVDARPPTSVNGTPVQGVVCMPVTVTTAHPVANVNLF